MKRVLATTFVAQAEMARVLLRKNGIPSMIEGDAIGIRGPATPIQVWVADGHYARALGLVRDSFSRKGRRKPAGRKRTVKRKTAKKKAAGKKKPAKRKAAPKRKRR